MLAQEVLLQLQMYNFELLLRQEPSERRRLRYITLAHIKDAVPPGRHALLMLDQAGWHMISKLPHLPDVTLLSPPAGSPELNPAEQVCTNCAIVARPINAMTTTNRASNPAATPGTN